MSEWIPFLEPAETVEQVYFFRTYRERLDESIPSQEILHSIKEEILATTKLPMAIDFLRGEILSTGRMSDGMERLPHYFRPFQTYIMSQAEEDRSRFDQRIALMVLEREAEYLQKEPSAAGLFIYQFESLARNRLGYDAGMQAMAADPHYHDDWSQWILKTRLQLGIVDFADLIDRHSQRYFLQHSSSKNRSSKKDSSIGPVLFGEQEGRIAKANHGKDPLFMFAALQRQLGYPTVPRATPKPKESPIHPAVEARLQRLEKRLLLLESEQKGPLDLSQFYEKPPEFNGLDDIE